MPAANVFDLTAATYDADRARLIPGYAKLYGGLVQLLPPTANSVLDLGAGTGLLSAWVRERFPEARLHLIDNAEAMLAKARARFAGDEGVSLQAADYCTCALEGPYDAVVSALSIHHLSDAAKRGLFGRVRAALKPGGVFLNAEQVLAPTPEQELAAREQWLDEVAEAGASAEQIQSSLLRQMEDRCATVANQLAWMKEAGFADTWCAYSRGRFALLAAEA